MTSAVKSMMAHSPRARSHPWRTPCITRGVVPAPLALVKELAAKMGAQVDLENKDPGVEISVRFPGSFPKGR